MSGKKDIRKRIYSCASDIITSVYRLFNQRAQGDIIYWGELNNLPDRIYELYLTDSMLQTIVEGIRDYVMGDGVKLSPEFESYIKNEMALSIKKNGKNELAINIDGDDFSDIVRQSILDYILFGTHADDLIYNNEDNICEHSYIDPLKLRLKSDKQSVRYYNYGLSTSSESYDIPLYGCWENVVELNKDGSIPPKAREIFFKFDKKCRTVYNLPTFYAALENFEIDRDITRYHRNALANGFSAFKILFYPGLNSEEEEAELARDYKNNYTGVYNSGRTMIVFDNGTGVPPEIITTPQDDFDKKYEALDTSNMTKMFASFRAQPVLFGILTKTTGFSEQEFFECYKLFFNAVIRQIRYEIIRDYEYIYGIDSLFEFIPSPLESQIVLSNNDDDPEDTDINNLNE